MKIIHYRDPLSLTFVSVIVVSLLWIFLPVGSFAMPTGIAEVAYDFSFPLDPNNYSLNGGYDFLQWSREGQAYHPGVDWNRNVDITCSDDLGDPVYAIATGTVVAAQDYAGSWGNIVLIEHVLRDGNKVWSQYAHLNRIDVKKDDPIFKGKQIGTIGKGGGNCAHLHWEIRISGLAADFWPSGKSQDWIRGLKPNGTKSCAKHLQPIVFRTTCAALLGVPSPLT